MSKSKFEKTIVQFLSILDNIKAIKNCNKCGFEPLSPRGVFVYPDLIGPTTNKNYCYVCIPIRKIKVNP